jgi:hypothetical protein
MALAAAVLHVFHAEDVAINLSRVVSSHDLKRVLVEGYITSRDGPGDSESATSRELARVTIDRKADFQVDRKGSHHRFERCRHDDALPRSPFI